MFCFVFHIFVPIIHYSCHITEAEGEVGYPLNWFKPPPQYFYTDRSKAVPSVVIPYCYLFLLYILQGFYFYTDRSKAVLLLWFLTVTCSCCPYLYFGSAIMLVTYFVIFR